MKCTDSYHSDDLYWAMCVKSWSKQCGDKEVMVFEGEDDEWKVEVNGVKRAYGQACTWTLKNNIEKFYFYEEEISV